MSPGGGAGGKMKEPVRLPSPAYVVHRGVRILRVDYSECVTPQVKVEHMEAAMREIAKAEPLSVLMLSICRPPLCMETREAEKRLARHNAPYVKASAIVGMNEFQRTVLWTMIADRQGKVEVFGNETRALDWLAEQAELEIAPKGRK